MQNELLNIIKRIPIVKRIRIRRALNHIAYKYLLSSEDILKAEKDEQYKLKLLKQQSLKWPEKSAELNSTIDKIVERNTRLSGCRNDMLFCYYSFGFTPHEYACYRFDSKNDAERKKYASDRQSVGYGYKFNDPDFFHIFMNKSETYSVLKSYYRRDGVKIASENDYESFVRFINKHPVFVKKDNDESCGRGVELVDTLKQNIALEDLFYSYLKSGVKFLEEVVRQGDEMATLNPSSVNTVRCFTLKNKNKTTVPYCFLKVGRNNSFVDNGGAGGILVGIDVNTGKINSNGIDEDGNIYVCHPDTGIVFNGYQLPKWKNMLSMCIEAAQIVPQIRLTGWDTAYSSDGWIVIEGNCLSELIGPQSTQDKGIKLELDNFLKELEE